MLQLSPVLIATQQAVVPFMFEEHNKLVDAINMVSVAYFSDVFVILRDELESWYMLLGESNPSKLAFQDALYAIICESDG
jgi:hypothetical protein